MDTQLIITTDAQPTSPVKNMASIRYFHASIRLRTIVWPPIAWSAARWRDYALQVQVTRSLADRKKLHNLSQGIVFRRIEAEFAQGARITGLNGFRLPAPRHLAPQSHTF